MISPRARGLLVSYIYFTYTVWGNRITTTIQKAGPLWVSDTCINRASTWLDEAERAEFAGLEEPFAVVHKVTLYAEGDNLAGPADHGQRMDGHDVLS